MAFINNSHIINSHNTPRKTDKLIRKTKFTDKLLLLTNFFNTNSNYLHKMYKYLILQPNKKTYTILFACSKIFFFPPPTQYSIYLSYSPLSVYY